jgi:hypothetical protein
MEGGAPPPGPDALFDSVGASRGERGGPISGGDASGGGMGGGGMGGGGMGGAGGGGGAGGAPDAGRDTGAALDAPVDAPVSLCTPLCPKFRQCCNGQCVNVANDPYNCGACGTRCGGTTSFCNGTCQAPPCTNVTCGRGACCGAVCCGAGQLCCLVEGPISGIGPGCYNVTPSQPTCPQGCAPLCVSTPQP